MHRKLTVALAAFAFAAVSPASFAQTTGTQADKPAKTAKSQSKSDGLARRDLRYFTDMAQDNMAEVQTGKLAQEKAQSEDVKKFAQHMVEDHGQMLDEQQSIAQAKNIEMPKQPKKEHRSALKKLQGASGEKFDQAYMDQMVKDHDKALKLTREAAKNAKDPQVRQAAEKAVPKIEEHLKMARQISGAAAGGTAAPKKK